MSRSAQVAAPRVAGRPAAYNDETMKEAFLSHRNRRSRELGVLLQYLADWLVTKVTQKPSVPFIDAIVKQAAPGSDVDVTLDLSKKESVDRFVRSMLGYVLSPEGLSLYDASNTANDADGKRTTRVAAYVRVLNACFGDTGGTGEANFELTPKVPTPFTPAQIEGILARGDRTNGIASTVLIGQGWANAYGPLLLRSMGGGAAKPAKTKTKPTAKPTAAPTARKAGTQYVPTIPRVSEVRRSTTPCMYERKVQKGEGYWAWRKERTDQAGVVKAQLVRVEKDQQTLVPIQCLQEYVNVLQGFDVQKTEEDDGKGNKIVRQTITPEVQVYGTVTPQGPAGPPIPYRDLPKFTDSYPAPPMPPPQQDLPFAVVGTSPATGHDLGGGAKAGGTAGAARAQARTGAAAQGGAMVLPRRSEVRNSQFYLTNQDIEDITTGVPADMMQKPAAWANINPPANPGEIAFYTFDDSYGVASTRRQQNGFPFSFKYLPFAYMTNQAYLEWLVSLDYKMRAEFPDEHSHVYDPLLDTIATVETAILVTLGKLEAKGQYFNRRDLFEGKEPFREVMHRYLRVYAFTPPQNTWYSPLSGRYIQLPQPPAPFPADEMAALDGLKALHDGVIMAALTGKPDSGLPEGFRVPLKYRGFGTAGLLNTPGGGPTAVMPSTFTASEARTVGVVEDELLSMLARLQYINGFAINTGGDTPVDIAGIVRNLLGTKVRRFLSREMVRYLEMFNLDERDVLHRLPGLRMREAAERGLVLPKSAMSQYGAGWQAATRAALPGLEIEGGRRASRPPNRYETVVRPPVLA